MREIEWFADLKNAADYELILLACVPDCPCHGVLIVDTSRSLDQEFLVGLGRYVDILPILCLDKI